MKKLNSADQLVVSKQFSTLLQASPPLLDVVTLMQMPGIANNLRQGCTLSASFQHLGFDMFCIGPLQTSEMSSSLVKIFFKTKFI